MNRRNSNSCPEPIPVMINLTHPHDPLLQKKKEWFIQQPGINWLYAETNKPLIREGGVLPILNLTRKGAYFESGKNRVSFHPSMALLRLIQILRGERDRFLQAVQLHEGDTFIDATLGLGTDALVASYQVGKSGKVLGIEHSPILAALVKEGLLNLAQGYYPRVNNPEKAKAWELLAEAAGRIEVLWGDHLQVLSKYTSEAVDVVYFDPMFRHTRTQSASIRPLHEFANPQPLSHEAIGEAVRVARRKVVLKERKGSPQFNRLGFIIQEGGNYSPVDYGAITKGDGL